MFFESESESPSKYKYIATPSMYIYVQALILNAKHTRTHTHIHTHMRALSLLSLSHTKHKDEWRAEFVNRRDFRDRNTALHTAVTRGHHAVVRILLSSGFVLSLSLSLSL